MPQLGERWRSILSGFEGIVVATIQYLTGCDQIGIKADGVDDKGAPRDAHYFDVPFCEFVKAADPKVLAARAILLGVSSTPTTGGPETSDRHAPR